MKTKSALIITIFFLFWSLPFSWGYQVHKGATLNACKLLEPYFGENFSEYTEYVAKLGGLPDGWKAVDRYESPNHYCDYDFFQEKNNLSLDNPFEKVKRAYGTEFLRKNGTVIWAIEEYYKLLVDSFENQDFSSALVYMAVSAHYIEDIHQPFHTTKNYDGQLTGNKGIHGRYESEMISRAGWQPAHIEDRTLPDLPASDNIRVFAIRIIETSASHVNEVLESDTRIRAEGTNIYDPKYYDDLWEETGGMTAERIRSAEKMTAVFILSAWKAAGSPEFPSGVNLLKGRIDEVKRPLFFRDGNRKIGDISQKKIVFSGVLAAIIFVGIISAIKDL